MSDPSWVNYSKIYDETSEPPYPYTIVEPVMDFSQPFMTFLMWSILFAVTIPAAIFDWWMTSYYDSHCKSVYGADWKAFSKFASTGRNDMLMMFNTDEKPCYNPTQCGMVRMRNDGESQTSTYNYYLKYIYDAAADKSLNPYNGEALTVMPMNGAKWTSGLTQEWSEILSEDVIAAGWYAESLPMETSDGVNLIKPNVMWDASRAYCTGYVNCEDLENDD